MGNVFQYNNLLELSRNYCKRVTQLNITERLFSQAKMVASTIRSSMTPFNLELSFLKLNTAFGTQKLLTNSLLMLTSRNLLRCEFKFKPHTFIFKITAVIGYLWQNSSNKIMGAAH